MADDEKSLRDEADALKAEVQQVVENVKQANNINDLDTIAYVFYLCTLWADFELTITEPLIEPITPPIIVPPLEDSETGHVEHVFNISDEGFRLSTSRGEQGLALGFSMTKFYNTIEKMVLMLTERLKTGGIDKESEVRIAFAGHEFGKRKAFESVLNLEENVVVVNYDAGDWGEKYMQNVLMLVERGYGLPRSSPRTGF